MLVALLLVVASCDTGRGSRLAPFFTDRPSRVLAGTVLDGNGKAVVSATVTLEGAGAVTTDAHGRFEFGEPPTGQRQITIDATRATATGTERFGTTVLTLPVPNGATTSVPWSEYALPFVLPDLAGAARAEVTIGTPTAQIDLDGRTNGIGPTLRIEAGTVPLRDAQASGTFAIEVATLRARDLPAPLPETAVGVLLPTAVVHVFPEDLRFGVSNARLEFSNDLALPVNARAFALRFDENTATWINVGAAVSNGTSLVPESNFVDRGGRYVFAAEVAATTLSGQLLDARKQPRADLYVDIFGRVATTDRDGRFVLGPLPAVDASGAPLQLSPRIHGSVPFVPAVFERSLPASLGATSLGSVELPVEAGGSLRYFVALRGLPEGPREVRVGSSAAGGSARFNRRDGFSEVRGLAAGWTNSLVAWSDGPRYFRGEAIAEIFSGRAGVDVQLLCREEELRPAELRGQFFARVFDARTGAPLRDAIVQGSAGATTGNKATTNAFGEASLNGDRFGVVTAALESWRSDGRAYRCVQSVSKIDNVRVEFPLERFTRLDPPTLREHALAEGNLTLVQPSSARRVLVHSLLRENDWFTLALGKDVDDLLLLPRPVDPATTGGTSFRLGLPTGIANLVAVEGQVVAGRFVPSRAGALVDLEVAAGSGLVRDIEVAVPFTRGLVFRDGLLGLDGRLPTTSLEYRLGGLRGDGSVLDVCPWSELLLAGSDVILLAPVASGAFVVQRYLAAVRARNETSGVTREQELFVDDVGVSSKGFVAVPELREPAANSTVGDASTFLVRWDAMTGVDFFELELVAVGDRAEDRLWRVFLAGDETEFRFGPLVQEAPRIVGPGLRYRLTLKAQRLDRGPAYRRPDGYQRLAGNLLSFRDGQRGVGARSTVSFEIRTP